LMERGAALLPGNGEAWDRIGRFWQFDFASPDSSKAVQAYLRAVRDDPNSSFYWMDLASGYEDVGDFARARQAFERAQSVYPISALVAWNYGNFLVRRGDDTQGYKKIREAVQSDKKLTPLAISRTWRSSDDVNSLLNGALPATADAYLQALNFFTSINRVDAALTVWNRLVALGQPVPLPETLAFLDKLIASDASSQALQVWRQALRLAGAPESEPKNGSLIRNGDFARDFANGGLDWRWASPFGVEAAFDAPPPSRSGRSLRLNFGGGANLALAAPAQFVPVEPNHTYHFHAYMRSAEITTDQGVHFSVLDPHHASAVNLTTEDFTGSHPWTAIDEELTSGPESHFLLVRLVREPSRLFDSKIAGTSWIADISLTPKSGSAPSAP